MSRSKDDWYEVTADPKHVARERDKARKLRKSQWWLDKLNQGLCHYCGRKVSPELLTMDHVVPVARGGTSTPGNIVASCKDCNSKKKLTTPVEQLLSKLRDERGGDGGEGEGP
ncbi:MAG: HNH endonuclease [Deltaproteobacteria bacterium]|nr:HNH endonuclease [Deltaproteobacteria bacterium]